ncbi:hypothetical protein F5H01DRAFT_384131 [Linnemannia elongata]|nr:hypothetical protein F5H01DRAFT_384131 [Linnemannia elongata]
MANTSIAMNTLLCSSGTVEDRSYTKCAWLDIVLGNPLITTDLTLRNPIYGPEEEAMEKYRNNDIPAFHPTPRAFQFILDTESPTSDPASDTWNGTNDLAQLIADANLGDSAAQVTPGDIYSKGDGVHQDYQTAMELYFKSPLKETQTLKTISVGCMPRGTACHRITPKRQNGT